MCFASSTTNSLVREIFFFLTVEGYFLLMQCRPYAYTYGSDVKFGLHLLYYAITRFLEGLSLAKRAQFEVLFSSVEGNFRKKFTNCR